MSEYLPPRFVELEQAVLGYAVSGMNEARLVLQELGEDDFQYSFHPIIYRAVAALARTAKHLDPALVDAEVQRRKQTTDTDEIVMGGYVGDLARIPRSTKVQIREYAVMIREAATRRRLLAAADKAAELARRDDVDRAVAEFQALGLTLRGRVQKGCPRSAVDLADELGEALQARMDAKSGNLGPTLGVENFDNVLGGFGDQFLVMVEGPTKFGKSTFCEQIVWNTLTRDDPLPMILYALEGDRFQRHRRFIVWHTQISAEKFKRGNGAGLTSSEKTLIHRAQQAWKALPGFYLQDGPADVGDIEAHTLNIAADLKAQGKRLGGIVIDYAQLVAGGEGKSTPERFEDCARRLQQLAGQIGAPVIVPSQVEFDESGEAYTRWSKAWTHNASLVLLLIRGTKDDKTREARMESPVLSVRCEAARDDRPFGLIEMHMRAECHRIFGQTGPTVSASPAPIRPRDESVREDDLFHDL